MFVKLDTASLKYDLRFHVNVAHIGYSIDTLTNYLSHCLTYMHPSEQKKRKPQYEACSTLDAEATFLIPIYKLHMK